MGANMGTNATTQSHHGPRQWLRFACVMMAEVTGPSPAHALRAKPAAHSAIKGQRPSR